MKLRWRLFAKYAVLIAALVSLTLIASGITSIWFSYEENQRQLVALQREKAIGAAARIEQYVKNIEHQLGWVTLSPPPEKRASSGVNGPCIRLGR